MIVIGVDVHSARHRCSAARSAPAHPRRLRAMPDDAGRDGVWNAFPDKAQIVQRTGFS